MTDERDLGQDIGFGIRQLADTAIKAMSPGINDPMTAVTCIGYLRSLLVRLAERADLEPVISYEEYPLTVVLRRRSFEEYLEPMLQINRYAAGDAWVASELLTALGAAMSAARNCGAEEREQLIREVATTIGEQAVRQAGNPRDVRLLEARMELFERAGT